MPPFFTTLPRLFLRFKPGAGAGGGARASLKAGLGGIRLRVLGHPFRVLSTTFKYLCFGHLFWAYGYSINAANGPSMLPTFAVEDEWILISKLHRYGRGVGVGDLVVYMIPIFPDTHGVKRVLGMPGDYVMLDSPESASDAMIQVPPGHCWVVGDNLPASRDSRAFGPVPLALVQGKVIARMWPFSEFEWIRNPLKSHGSALDA